MKILLVAGARPNFMKIASIIDAIKAHNRSAKATPIAHVLVHTGQHYDNQMSDVFFQDLGLPTPDIDLEVGSSSHALQTAEIMKRFEPVLMKERPDVLLVVGDVNSTIACSLVASKIVYPGSADPTGRTRPLIAHVEAGLRSFDRSMPEEVNRILTDALSDFLFITEQSAEVNLLKDGVPKEKIHLVGNTMVDTLLKHRDRAKQSGILARLDPQIRSDRGGRGEYMVLTLHRPSNVDDPKTLREILEALAVLTKDTPCFFPVHPRTRHRLREFRLDHYFNFLPDPSQRPVSDARVYGLEPLGYLDFLCLMSNAKLVLTDSGGIQEETTVLGVPCVTLRHNTERPATMTNGTNVLAGTDKDAIVRHALGQLNRPNASNLPQFWDGRAGERVIAVLAREVHGSV
jgi:UDP-N-acetylglucosamine 2-epimerase (non-hydrolysing)